METGLAWHSSIWHNNKIIIFGGINSSKKGSNEVLIYDISAAKWDKAKTIGCLPSKNFRHTATKIEQNGKVLMLVFGGKRNKKGDVFALNLINMEWIKLDNVNYKRYYHTANVFEQDIYLFGGVTAEHKNDIQVYNSEKETL